MDLRILRGTSSARSSPRYPRCESRDIERRRITVGSAISISISSHRLPTSFPDVFLYIHAFTFQISFTLAQYVCMRRWAESDLTIGTKCSRYHASRVRERAGRVVYVHSIRNLCDRPIPSHTHARECVLPPCPARIQFFRVPHRKTI